MSGQDSEIIRKGETEEALRLRLSAMASMQAVGWPLRTWRENPSAFGNYRPAPSSAADGRDNAV